MQTLRKSLRKIRWTCACGVVVGMICWPARAATTNVHFGNFYFSPTIVTIQAGDTIVWTNDGGTHTVTGTGSDPMCGNGDIAASCSHTFSTPGMYPYECIHHFSFGMTGVVNVAAAPVPPALLTNEVRLPNGQFQFTVQSTVNHTNLIQATTNVASSTNWVYIGSVVPTTNTFVFTDTNANQFQLRFYRVAEP